MFEKSEDAIVQTAADYILKKIAAHGHCRIRGFGEFKVSELTYRDMQDGEMKRTYTLKFRPFTAAKRVAKDPTTPHPKPAKGSPPRTTSKPKKKKKKTPKPEQLMTPGTYIEAEKKTEEPVSKPLPQSKPKFAFKL